MKLTKKHINNNNNVNYETRFVSYDCHAIISHSALTLFYDHIQLEYWRQLNEIWEPIWRQLNEAGNHTY